MVEKTKAMAALFGLLVFASLALVFAGGLGFAAEGQAAGKGTEVNTAPGAQAPAGALSCGEAGCGNKSGAACGASGECKEGCGCQKGGAGGASCGASCGCGAGKCTGGCECKSGGACTGTCGCGMKAPSGAKAEGCGCGKAAQS